MSSIALDDKVAAIVDHMSLTNALLAIDRAMHNEHLMPTDRAQLRETGQLICACGPEPIVTITPELNYKAIAHRVVFYDAIEHVRSLPKTPQLLADVGETLLAVANGQRYVRKHLKDAFALISHAKSHYYGIMNRGSGQI